MLNEVLRLTQGDLSSVIKEDEGKEEIERNNEAFYKDYQGVSNVNN